MVKLQNKERVSEIFMYPTACVKCQLGQDWYGIEFDVCFCPGECYPDYMEVQAFIMEQIDGKELNIEQAARILYDHLQKYEPSELEVTANVSNNKVHFDVSVTID